MNTDQPDDQYLSPIAQQVAECYAVVYPEAIARSKVLKWLNTARKVTAGQKGLTSTQVADAIKDLVKAGILEPSIEGRKGHTARGPKARPGHLTRFCENAEKRGIYDLILDQLDDSTYYGYQPAGAIPYGLVEQFARHAMITRTIDTFPIESIRPEMWLWLLEPAAKSYLQLIPRTYLPNVCIICMSALVGRLQPFSEFAKTADEVNPAGQHQVVTARGLIFQGQLAKAQSLIKKLQKEHPADKPICLECESMLALICLLTGDDKTAMQHIEATLALEGSGTKKRILYPDTISFSLSLFALTRIATLESRLLFESLLQARKKLKIQSKLDWPLQVAAQAENPQTNLHPSLPRGEPDIDTVLHAIASRWHTDCHHPEGHEVVARLLKNLWCQASAAGYEWVVAETQTVMEANEVDGKQKKILIKEEFGGLSASKRHEAIGTTTLTQLVTALEPWEFSLQALEQLALKVKPVKVSNKTPATTSRRLIWQINELYDGVVEVVPMEQTLGKSGKWSGGRKVALKRLKDNASSMDHLIPQDVKACAAIQKVSYGWDRTTVYETDLRTFYQLVGHPHVYDEHGQLVDVVEQPAALTVTDSNIQLQLSVEPFFTGAHYAVRLEYPDHRAYVTHFNAGQRRIAEAIQSEGLLIPLQAKGRLQVILDALAGEMAVQSDQQLATPEMQDGVAELLLEIEPAGQSLRVRLRVEPLPDSGMYFDVATGGAVVYITTAAGSVPVKRNLQHERNKLDELLLRSDVLAGYYDGRTFFVIEHPIDALELLEDAQANGIRCLWPGDIPFRIKARADLAQVSLSFKKAKDWFSASGSLDVTDENTDPMSIAHLLRLMQAQPNSRFIELGKGEFLALSHKLKQQLDSLQAFSRPEKTETEDNQVHPMALLALEPLLDAASVKSDKAWKDHRKQIKKALETKAPVPANLQAELRSYQLEGYNWLEQLGQIGAGACLADDMGLGKTVQTLALLLARAEGGPALVVAPTSVVGNWLQESQRFAPSLNVAAYGESSQSRSELLSDATSSDLIIISYGLIVRDIEALTKVHWHTVVLDEAQAIKNAATQRAKCVKQLNADFRVVTTGTPVQNNLMDLHSLFGFLNPQLLGSAASFRQHYALPITKDNDDHAREQLQKIIAPFLLRRHKRDVLKELPDRTELTLKVKMSREETALYEMIRKDALESLEQSSSGKLSASSNQESNRKTDKKKKGKQSASQATTPNSAQQKMIILSYLTKLRRLCCHPSLIQPNWTGPESKLEVFSETLNELISSGHRALVFSQFVDHLKIVEKHLKNQDISYQYLDGSTTAKQRTQRVSDFQAGEGQVFLISLNAGGAGLNLTAADYVIHLDPWWNPAVEDQASDRAHRIGQQRPVTIVRMVTTGTIEEQIQELHTTKRELADSVLAGADSPSLNMDTMMKLLRGQQLS